MKELTLNQFINALGWTPAMQDKLLAFTDRDDIKYLVAWQNAGKLSASAFTDVPDEWPDNAIAVWKKFKDVESPVNEPISSSKTMQALALVDQGLSRYAAAKQVGISESAVHRAFHRRKDKPICPCCNQVVPDAFSINRFVLKDQPSD
jgi:hypothetical protein